MAQTIKTVEDYIAQFPPDVQALLTQMRDIIRGQAPQATEGISWGMPTYKLGGNLVHFANGKHHIGFYPGASGVQAFLGQLGAYKTSKGAIQFPKNQPLPTQLIEKIVRFRVQENSTAL